MRILTNHPGQASSSTWERLATRVRPGAGISGDVKCAVQLLVRAPEFDCVVLGAGRSDIIYSALAAIVPVRLPPAYRIDCLWYLPRNRLYSLFKRFCFYLERRSVRRYFVWASREVEAYSKVYPVPAEKIEFLPFHHTINNEAVEVKNHGYIFSGGNFARDYLTLAKAVEGLDIAVRIATTRPELFANTRLPDNVEVNQYTHRGYLEVMAGCRINIVALAAGGLHSAGQQTFLNSMALGKPTIVTDPDGAIDYIRDGHNGLLVGPGDHEALRAAILRILGDPDLERELGTNALDARVKHSTECHFATMVARIASDLDMAAPLNNGQGVSG